MPALFRQSPLNGIWEGSGNVICLDVLRAVEREPKCVHALFSELEKSIETAEAIGGNSYAGTVRSLQSKLKLGRGSRKELEFGARALVDRLALCLAGAVLMQDGDAVVAKAFLRTRLPPGCATEAAIPHHSVGAMAGSALDEKDVSHLIVRLGVGIE